MPLALPLGLAAQQRACSQAQQPVDAQGTGQATRGGEGGGRGGGPAATSPAQQPPGRDLHIPRLPRRQAATAEAGADKPVVIANFLCPGNYAVSGSKEGCDAVEKLGKSFGAR
jgi:hypothetical protein